MRLVPSKLLAFAIIGMLTDACRGPAIPNQISEREYALYADWTNNALKTAPKALFFYSRTMPFNPFEPYDQCVNQVGEKEGVFRPMIRQLRALGSAQYPLDLFSSRTFHVAWKYRKIESPPTDPEFGYRALTFSRVAFNRAGDLAIFSVSNSCAGGQCGGGGVIIAHKTQGTWEFQRTDCNWVF